MGKSLDSHLEQEGTMASSGVARSPISRFTGILGVGLHQDRGGPDCVAAETGWDQLRIKELGAGSLQRDSPAGAAHMGR